MSFGLRGRESGGRIPRGLTPCFGTEITKTYSLQITREPAASSPIDTWRQTYFTFRANDGDEADSFDFDNDNLVNLLEFAFGSDPTLADSGHDQIPKAKKVGTNLVITFTKPTGVSGISYGAETSNALVGGTWTPVPDTGTGTTHTFSVPITTSDTFIRLAITNPDP